LNTVDPDDNLARVDSEPSDDPPAHDKNSLVIPLSSTASLSTTESSVNSPNDSSNASNATEETKGLVHDGSNHEDRSIYIPLDHTDDHNKGESDDVFLADNATSTAVAEIQPIPEILSTLVDEQDFDGDHVVERSVFVPSGNLIQAHDAIHKESTICSLEWLAIFMGVFGVVLTAMSCVLILVAVKSSANVPFVEKSQPNTTTTFANATIIVPASPIVLPSMASSPHAPPTESDHAVKLVTSTDMVPNTASQSSSRTTSAVMAKAAYEVRRQRFKRNSRMLVVDRSYSLPGPKVPEIAPDQEETQGDALGHKVDDRPRTWHPKVLAKVPFQPNAAADLCDNLEENAFFHPNARLWSHMDMQDLWLACRLTQAPNQGTEDE